MASAAVSGVLERIVRAAGRRPGRVLARGRARGRGPAALALRLEPSAATDTLVGRERGAYQATEGYRERFGDDAVVVLVRGDLPNLVLTDDLGRLLGLEGCLSGNKPADEPAPGGRGLAVRGARAHQAGGGRLRAGHVHQRGGRRDQRPVPAQLGQQGGGGRAREARRRAGWREAQGALARPSRTKARAGRRAARLRAVHARPAPARPALRARAQGAAAARRPRLRLRARLRPARGATTPKARFAYLFPNAQLGGHPGAAQARPDARRSGGARSRSCASAVAMKQWRLKDGASYSGHRRAGGGRGPRGGAHRTRCCGCSSSRCS